MRGSPRRTRPPVVGLSFVICRCVGVFVVGSVERWLGLLVKSVQRREVEKKSERLKGLFVCWMVLAVGIGW